MTATTEAGTGPGFDQVLDGLRSVVDRLEQGSLSLEEALAAYEEGVKLARRGHELLDRAESRIEVLVADGQGGQTTEPLEGTTSAED